MLGQVKRCRHWGLSAGKPCALQRRQCRVLLHQQLTNGWASEELQMPGHSHGVLLAGSTQYVCQKCCKAGLCWGS